VAKTFKRTSKISLEQLLEAGAALSFGLDQRDGNT